MKHRIMICLTAALAGGALSACGGGGDGSPLSVQGQSVQKIASAALPALSTSNPPAIPWNAQENFPLIGFVQLTLGATAIDYTIDYTVQANQAWQDTGLAVHADSKIRVEYLSGKWTADPYTNNGNLYDAAGCPGLIMTQPGYPSVDADLQANMGALMGRIGGEGGKVILIGDGPVSLPAGYSGNLELCINDDLKGHYGAGLADNQGAVCVSIRLG